MTLLLILRLSTLNKEEKMTRSLINYLLNDLLAAGPHQGSCKNGHLVKSPRQIQLLFLSHFDHGHFHFSQCMLTENTSLSLIEQFVTNLNSSLPVGSCLVIQVPYLLGILLVKTQEQSSQSHGRNSVHLDMYTVYGEDGLLKSKVHIRIGRKVDFESQ